MFGAARGSTVSGPACGPGPAATSSKGVAAKVVAASARRGRPYAPLRSSSDIGRVRRRGIRRREGGITVFVSPGDADVPRVAFVASRALGPAVRRNRAKRRLREASGRVPLQAGRDYVVIASEAVIEAPFVDLVAWLARAVTEED